MLRIFVLRAIGLVFLSAMVTGCAPSPLTGIVEQPFRIVKVGRDHPIKTIEAAARAARDGDIIEISAGAYVGDTAVWTQNNIRIRGVNGRPRLIAAGKAAEAKAIWVIRGNDIVVENIEFTGARVSGRNGAGIRFERGKLTVRRCVFTDNENGILVGNDRSTVLEVEDSEFGNNGAGDGQSHNLYVGLIQRFVVQGSYFHNARVGHLLKSRARENFVSYNRLTDERGGRASYELEFPSGGFAVVIGNLIQQSETTENSTIISFGAEGYHWPRNELYIAHNTIVNGRSEDGTFVWARSGSAYVMVANNLLAGTGDLDIKARTDIGQNWRAGTSDFISVEQYDYRLRPESPLVGAASHPGEAGEISLRPMRQYIYPLGTTVGSDLERLNPGAFQEVTRSFHK